MTVWKLSAHIRHVTVPVLRCRSSLTSHDCSWLQKGQLNWVSSAPVSFFFGGGFLFAFRLPILTIRGVGESCVRGRYV